MSGSLRRTLGFRDLTLIVVGSVIGSGIFIVPSVVLRLAGGSVGVAMLVWLAGGVLSLLGALTYGELGAMDRGSGGLYSYIRNAFGPLPAFLYGWTLFFVIGSGTIATLAVATSTYMGQFIPLSPVAGKVVAVALVAIMAITNVLGTRESATLQNWATWLKVGVIALMTLLLVPLGGHLGGELSSGLWPATFTTTLASGIGLAMISVLWAYEGWQYVTFSCGEATDVQRTFPRAIALGTAALIAIYMLANVAYVAALGAEGVAGSQRVAADAVTAVLGPLAGRLVSLAIIISMYSAAHVTVLTAPRVYFVMAREGMFFKRLAEVHPRFGTPAFAIVTSCIWTALLAATGTFEQLLTYVVFVGWIFYALGALALIALRRSRPDAERPFRVPGYPVTPILFVASAVAIVGNTIYSQPVRSAIGIGMVLLGVPAYLIWRRRAAEPGTPEVVAEASA
jgi:basic amino acid/polyamine antiporter, APA family